ncbi:hypothetical protein [Haloplanus natans]|uniref:hypothetical protein n=1 Tax=Haloplanus natans TaxID=376171 RepID=UPI0012FC6C2C|nr:hypothetical protein [Haloplanus natans]
MGLGQYNSGPTDGHDSLPGILDEVIPEVVRDRIFGTHPKYSDITPNEVTDQGILDAVDWDKTPKRQRKWLWMCGEVVLWADKRRERSEMYRLQETRSEGFGQTTSLNWQNCYNEAADAVAIYLNDASCAESVKDGLRRQTFGSEISISVPREVLRQVEARVREHENVNPDAVIAAHKEAVEHRV